MVNAVPAGSIAVFFSCPSLRALNQLEEMLATDHLKYHLGEIFKELCKLYEINLTPTELNVNIDDLEAARIYLKAKDIDFQENREQASENVEFNKKPCRGTYDEKTDKMQNDKTINQEIDDMKICLDIDNKKSSLTYDCEKQVQPEDDQRQYDIVDGEKLIKEIIKEKKAVNEKEKNPGQEVYQEKNNQPMKFTDPGKEVHDMKLGWQVEDEKLGINDKLDFNRKMKNSVFNATSTQHGISEKPLLKVNAHIDAVKHSDQIPFRAKIHPKYLHANSTSHVWIFSAVAELVDNARDAWNAWVHEHLEKMKTSHSIRSPSHTNSNKSLFSASVVPLCSRDFILQIDTSEQDSKPCLVLTDNGCGMNEKGLLEMLSLGYTHDNTGNMPRIGQYGNGFKSGTMRIGKDIVVLTISHDSWCIGLLSQSYLNAIGADEIFVPIVTIDKYTKTPNINADTDLNIIKKYSIFNSLKEIVKEFEDMKSNIGKNETGTRVIIYNLKEGQLDFETDKNDIINCQIDTGACEMNYRRSLREYCSILYMPNSSQSITANNSKMKIYLRDKLVVQKDMTKLLKRKSVVPYKHRDHKVEITFGYTPEQELDYGMMLYHKNRLIKYEKVGCQKKNNEEVKGVVGIVHVDELLEPNHIKQDFNRTDSFTTVMKEFGAKLNKFCDSWTPKRKNFAQSNYPLKRFSNQQEGCMKGTDIRQTLDHRGNLPHPEQDSDLSLQDKIEEENFTGFDKMLFSPYHSLPCCDSESNMHPIINRRSLRSSVTETTQDSNEEPDFNESSSLTRSKRHRIKTKTKIFEPKITESTQDSDVELVYEEMGASTCTELHQNKPKRNEPRVAETAQDSDVELVYEEIGASTHTKIHHRKKPKRKILKRLVTVSDATSEDGSLDVDQQEDKSFKVADYKIPTTGKLTKLRETIKELLEIDYPMSFKKLSKNGKINLADIDKIVTEIVIQRKNAKSQK